MTINIAGIEIETRLASHNASSAPHLLCLHGIGGDHNSFRPQLDELSDAFTVSSWNMPGYRSSRPLSSITFDNLVTSVLELLDAMEIPSVHLIGQSIGGMITQEFALTAPDRVTSLILIATTSAFGGTDEKFHKEFLKARLAPLENGMSIQELAQQAIPAITGSTCPSAIRDAAIDSMQHLAREVYEEVLRCLVTFNRRDDIHEIQHPVCLIAGEEDTNAPARTMEKMAARFPNAHYHVISEAGHLTNIEKPTECNQLIENFIAGLSTV